MLGAIRKYDVLFRSNMTAVVSVAAFFSEIIVAILWVAIFGWVALVVVVLAIFLFGNRVTYLVHQINPTITSVVYIAMQAYGLLLVYPWLEARI
jgi:fatty acid desaturase